MQDRLLLSPLNHLKIEGFTDADWGAQPDVGAVQVDIWFI